MQYRFFIIAFPYVKRLPASSSNVFAGMHQRNIKPAKRRPKRIYPPAPLIDNTARPKRTVPQGPHSVCSNAPRATSPAPHFKSKAAAHGLHYLAASNTDPAIYSSSSFSSSGYIGNAIVCFAAYSLFGKSPSEYPNALKHSCTCSGNG